LYHSEAKYLVSTEYLPVLVLPLFLDPSAVAANHLRFCIDAYTCHCIDLEETAFQPLQGYLNITKVQGDNLTSHCKIIRPVEQKRYRLLAPTFSMCDQTHSAI
jgi:hypothetical protein